MPLYQVSLYFRFETRTWQEIYYRDASTARIAATIANPDLLAYMKGKDYGSVLEYTRAREVTNPRRGYTNIARIAKKRSATAAFVTGVDTPDVTATAFLMELRGANGERRKLWYRGLRDEIVLRDEFGNPDFSAALPTANAVFALVQGYNLGILQRLPYSNNAARRQTVLEVQGVDAMRTKLTMSAADVTNLVTNKWQQFDGGQSWKILVATGGSDKRNFPGMGGTYTVLSTDATSVTISYSMPNGDTGPHATQKTTVRNLQYLLVPINELVKFDFSTRDTGGNFKGPRGRSKAHTSRH